MGKEFNEILVHVPNSPATREIRRLVDKAVRDGELPESVGAIVVFPEEQPPYVHPHFTFDVKRSALSNGDTTVLLSQQERSMLLLLTQQANQTVTRDEITAVAWPENYRSQIQLGNSFNVALHNLRKKLGLVNEFKIDPKEVIRRVGTAKYMLVDPTKRVN